MAGQFTRPAWMQAADAAMEQWIPGRKATFYMRDVNPQWPVQSASNPRLLPALPQSLGSPVQPMPTMQAALNPGAPAPLALNPAPTPIPLGPAPAPTPGLGAQIGDRSYLSNLSKADIAEMVRAKRFGSGGPATPPPSTPFKTLYADGGGVKAAATPMSTASPLSTAAANQATGPNSYVSYADDLAPRISAGGVSTPPLTPIQEASAVATKNRLGLGGMLKSAGLGAAVGIGGSLGLNAASQAIRPNNPGVADALAAGGVAAIPGGAVGVPLAGALGFSGLGATAAGATAPIAGAGIGQAFTGTEFGNDVVNSNRGAYSPGEEGNNGLYDAAVSGAGALLSGGPLTGLAMRAIGGGEKTDQDLLDVMGGAPGEGVAAEAPVLAPQERVNKMFDITGLPPETRNHLQGLYEAMVASGQPEEDVSKIIMDETLAQYQQQEADRVSMAQMAAQQQQAMNYIQPYAQSIRAQGQADQQLLQSLSGMLPPQMQAYGQYAANSAPMRANTLADSYMAQAGLAPGQAAQQRELQAQQAYDQQLASQIQNLEIAQQIQDMQAQGLAPTPASGGI